MNRPKKFLLIVAICLVVCAIVWLILAVVNNWDILGFLCSSKAILIYVILGFYAAGVVYVLLSDKDIK